MFTALKHLCKNLRLVCLSVSVLVLCCSFLLLGIIVPSAHAASLVQNAPVTAASATQPRLQSVTLLGFAGPGGVAMENANVGWTLTSALQHTSDGGKTWHTVARGSSSEIMGGAFILNGQVAWYETYDAQTFTTAALYRTSNSGQTWTRFAWADPSLSVNSLSIVNGQYAWIVGADYNADTPVFKLYLFGTSSQSGWQQVTPPASGPNSVLNSVYFRSKNVGWLTAVIPNVNGNDLWILYGTRDGGQTWTQTSLQLPAGVPDTAVLTNVRFPGFGDQQEGYLTATFGDSASYMVYSTQVYRTQDGGSSWQAYGAVKPEEGQIVRIDNWHVVDATFQFVAVGGEEQLASLQAGVWSIQSLTLPPNMPSTPFLVVLNAQLMFASAEDAGDSSQVLYRSRNGGASWQEIATIPNPA